MIRIDIETTLGELWATSEQFATMTDTQIIELCRNDVSALLDGALWRVRRDGPDKMSRCSGCSGDIRWKKTEAGKNTPLNLDGSPHWGTCPKAKDFKKGKSA